VLLSAVVHRGVRSLMVLPRAVHPRPPARPAVEVSLVAALAVLTGLSGVLAGDGLALPLALAWAPLLLLWWRHDAPALVFLLVLLAVPSRGLYGANGPSELLVLVAVFTVGSRLPARWAAGAVLLDASVVAVTLASTAVSDAVPLESGGQLLAASVVALAGRYVAGRRQTEHSLAARAEEARAEAAARARVAVDDERRRIARELHDVVAHHVSVMTLQAGALRTQLRQRGADETAIEVAEGIRRTGQEAMTELRRLLGVLRAADPVTERSPQPDLAALEGLVERMRATGMTVDLGIDGPVDEVTAGMALAVHRIVQEALTNTLRHAGPVPAAVLVRIHPCEVEVVVRDRGPAHPSAPPYPGGTDEPTGRGLVGMRERAAIFGGAVRASPHPDGGFEVRAVLPRNHAPRA
jgi:signal transduction histidine kinase